MDGTGKWLLWGFRGQCAPFVAELSGDPPSRAAWRWTRYDHATNTNIHGRSLVVRAVNRTAAVGFWDLG